MAKEKLIIIEGPRGTGKTTVTNWLRDKLSYTNLFRMCGNPDNSIEGCKTTMFMYENLMSYIRTMQSCGMNLLFDRTFITEQAYNYLGVKNYDFTQCYNHNLQLLLGLDFDIYIIFLKNSDLTVIEERLHKDKCDYLSIPYTVENSLQQHKAYSRVYEELKEKEIPGKHFIIELNTDSESLWKSVLSSIFKIEV